MSLQKEVLSGLAHSCSAPCGSRWRRGDRVFLTFFLPSFSAKFFLPIATAAAYNVRAFALGGRIPP
jgi:hypothetical protein